MKIRNATDRVVTTWTGHEIQPGQTATVDISAAEAEWQLRHGCEDADATADSTPPPVMGEADETDAPTPFRKVRSKVRRKK